MTELVPWSHEVGLLPHRVVAYEDFARKGVVYLRWRVEKVGKARKDGRRDATEWTRKSLGFTLGRDRRGKVLREDAERAVQEAERQYHTLVTGGQLAPVAKAELTIAEGWKRATDPETGRWPADTMHRREMARSIDAAKSILGPRTTWNSIGKPELRKLWRGELKRQRAAGHDGIRSTEIVVTRLLSVAGWLRDEELIKPTACLRWRRMREEMDADFERAHGEPYQPHQPRHTLEEYRKLLAAADDIDPRWGLLLCLGAEYRLGQVVRVYRRHVQVQPDPFVVRIGIPGRGKKKGATFELTTGQQRRLAHAFTEGHLRKLEAAYLADEIADYPLFYGGRIVAVKGSREPVGEVRHHTRNPLDRTQLRKWLGETCAKAKVKAQPGMGWYSLRRVSVDGAKEEKISREGLTAAGGWSTPAVPDTIYADQDKQYAWAEAAEVRAKLRHEVAVSPDEQDRISGAIRSKRQTALPKQSRRRSSN